MEAKIQALLKEVSKGDEHAFKQLFDAYSPNIYTTVLRLTGDDWKAEEIMQETFIKVWLYREKLHTIDDFETWLYVVAKNMTYNVLKRSQKEKELSDTVLAQNLATQYNPTEYAVQEREFQRILQEAIAQLTPKQQLTYRLIKEKNLKRNEVAKILDVSPETVKWNLDQAMRSIRAYCKKYIKDIPFIFILHYFTKYFF